VRGFPRPRILVDAALNVDRYRTVGLGQLLLEVGQAVMLELQCERVVQVARKRALADTPLGFGYAFTIQRRRDLRGCHHSDPTRSRIVVNSPPSTANCEPAEASRIALVIASGRHGWVGR
jgi:hypothetical protein